MKNKNNIPDALFQQSFEGFSPPPSKNVWAGLQNQLLEKQAAEKRKKKRFFFWLSSIGTVLLIATFSQFLDILNIDRKFLDKQISTSEIKSSEKGGSVVASSNITSSLKSNSLTQKAGNKLVVNTSSQVNNTILDKDQTTISVVNDKKGFLSDVVANNDEGRTIEKDIARIKTIESNIEKFTQVSVLEHLKIPLLEQKNSPLNMKKIEPIVPKFRDRVSISFVALNSVFNRRLKPNATINAGPNETSQFYNQHESKHSNWSYTLKLGLEINKKWRVETGLGLTQFSMLSNYDVPTIFNENTASDAILFTSFNTNNIRFNLKNTTGLEQNDLVAINENFEQRIRWVTIPLMATYKLGRGPIQLNLSAGLSANFHLNSEIFIQESSATIENFEHVFSEDAGKMHFAYRGEANLYYRANTEDSFFIGVHHQNAFTPANNRKAVEFYPSMLGWQMGIQRFF